MRQHGEYKVWLDNKIVCAYLKGAWNYETVVAFAAACRQASQPLIGKPWAHIAYFDDWALGVPEIEPVIQELVVWARERGLMRIAHVYSPSMLKRYQLARMVPEDAGPILKRVFEQEGPAFVWLADEGFVSSKSATLIQA